MNLFKLTLFAFTVSFISTNCTSSKVFSLEQSSITGLPDESPDNGPTIFLLERDIPTAIDKLGIVSIGVGTGKNVDKLVKQELIICCRKLNANGAYRINDGFYPSISRISYLVFRYIK